MAGIGLLCPATETEVSVGDYTVRVWQVEQGLPQMSVTSIAQTPNGYLWLGTFNGLVRFDGLRFTVFHEANTPALGSSRVVRLLTDQQGVLWIVSEEGHLACLADDQFVAYDRDQGLPASGAAALVTDLQGRLFVVDRDRGIHRLEDRRLSTTPPAPARPDPGPGLLVAPSEPCWVDRQGLAINSSQIALRFAVTGPNPSNHLELVVPCAAPAREGGHWLATTSGVFHLRDGRVPAQPLAFPEPLSALTSIAEDGRGNLWVGSWASGLFLRNPAGQWQRFSLGAGLAENDVTTLFVDREDNVWVGTSSGGLHRFKRALFRNYDRSHGLPGNNVRSVTEDRAGRLWIGVNGGGLSYWENERVAPATEPRELQEHPLVYSVMADRQDTLWLGAYGGKILRLQDGALATFFFGDQSPQGMTPRAIFEDHSGNIWFGCDGGLLRYQAGHFTLFGRESGLIHDQVHALAQDRHGTLYLGTYGGGLGCYTTNGFGSYSEPGPLPDGHILALQVDRDDTLWIGTLYGGLARWRNNEVACVTVRDGLPSETIGSIQEDDLGNLWLGTSRGIVRLRRHDLNDYLDGGRRSLPCRVFDSSDGLNTLDCGGGGQPASWKARDGRIWFATVKGAAVVDPTQVPFNSLPPTAVIEEAVLDGGPTAGHGSNRASTLDHATGLRIPPGQHRLELHFTGLSLEAPEKVRFRYRLEGLDPGWVDSGTRRTASFSPVPPGTYRFEVTACNQDGVWSNLPASLPITVLPYFWETAWFKVLVVVALCGATGLLARLAYLHRARRQLQRLESRYALESERSRIARDIHDDLGARLTQIGLLAEFAKRSVGRPEQTHSYLDQLAQRSRDMTQAMDEVVWAVDPARDSVEGLLSYLGPLAQKFFQGTKVRCRLDFPPALPPQTVSARARHGLLLAVKEALNNCLKHARASEILIRSRLQGSVLSLDIEDNGRGCRDRDPEPTRGGHGIQNMRHRIASLGGEFRLDCRSGTGTRIHIAVDLAHIPPDNEDGAARNADLPDRASAASGPPSLNPGAGTSRLLEGDPA